MARSLVRLTPDDAGAAPAPGANAMSFPVHLIRMHRQIMWDPNILVPESWLEPVGTAHIAGREGFRLLGRPRSTSHDFLLFPKGDSYDVVVDTKRGILLRSRSGQPHGTTRREAVRPLPGCSSRRGVKGTETPIRLVTCIFRATCDVTPCRERARGTLKGTETPIRRMTCIF